MLTARRRGPTPNEKDSTPSTKAEDHKNEGFLKSTWHRLTHQHDSLEPEKQEKDGKPESPEKEDDEPKKASGSG